MAVVCAEAARPAVHVALLLWKEAGYRNRRTVGFNLSRAAALLQVDPETTRGGAAIPGTGRVGDGSPSTGPAVGSDDPRRAAVCPECGGPLNDRRRAGVVASGYVHAVGRREARSLRFADCAKWPGGKRDDPDGPDPETSSPERLHRRRCRGMGSRCQRSPRLPRHHRHHCRSRGRRPSASRRQRPATWPPGGRRPSALPSCGYGCGPAARSRCGVGSGTATAAGILGGRPWP